MFVRKKYRTFWRRFGAAAVDCLALWPLFSLEEWLEVRQATIAEDALCLVLFCLAPYIYSIYLHGRFGQTLGKRLLRIKVVDVSGDALTMAQVFRRELINLPLSLWALVTSLVVILGGGNQDDPMTTLGSRQRRSLHDRIAHSVVVRVDALPEVTRAPRPAGCPQ